MIPNLEEDHGNTQGSNPFQKVGFVDLRGLQIGNEGMRQTEVFQGGS
jgi:hypothetical protein